MRGFSDGLLFVSGTLKAWTDMSIPRAHWDVPLLYLAPVLGIACISLGSSALWAGALTPIASFEYAQAAVRIPSYQNTSLIREYPSEVDGTGRFLVHNLGPSSHTRLVSNCWGISIVSAGSSGNGGWISPHTPEDR